MDKQEVKKILSSQLKIKQIITLRSNKLGKLFLITTNTNREVYVGNKNDQKKQKRAFQVMSYLNKINFPSPRAISYLEKENLLVYEQLKGEVYLEEFKKNINLKRVEKQVEKICRLIFNFHKIKLEKIKFQKKENKKNLMQEKSWTDGAIRSSSYKNKDYILNLQNSLWKEYFKIWNKLNFKLTHSDFTPDNIIFNKEAFGLTDFYDVSMSDPFKDVASFNVRLIMMANHYPKQYSSLKIRKHNSNNLEQTVLKTYLKLSKDKKFADLRYNFWKNFWFSRMYAWFTEVIKEEPPKAIFLLDELNKLSKRLKKHENRILLLK